MSVSQRITEITSQLPPSTRLVAVSKFQPAEAVMEAYRAGQRLFGESRAQELAAKYEALPKDIEWHFIGHLQTNKIKYILPIASLIHSVDSYKLLEAINKEAEKIDRVVSVLLEIHIAKEETKSGFTPEECLGMLEEGEWKKCSHVKICGLMGMATYTDNKEQIREEFHALSSLFREIKEKYLPEDFFKELSMGMSEDYLIAIEESGTLVRIGSSIFGERHY